MAEAPQHPQPPVIPGVAGLRRKITTTTTCRLCGDQLHLTAVPGDEYGWVDASGHQMGLHADLRHYGGPGAGYERLGWLFATIREHQSSRRGTLTPAQYDALMTEYVGLAVRLDGMHSQWHVHYPGEHEPWEGAVPDHCGRPMWLRPSGWHCRVCAWRGCAPA